MKNKKTLIIGGKSLSTIGFIFVVAKILKLLSWSWWIVLIPFYSIPAIVFIIFLVWCLLIIIRSFKR